MRTTLQGVLVVALEQAVAAPLCTARLAEAGARVIKIERPEGDFARHYDHAVHGESAYFVWLNRGKESLVLDLKDANDAALLAAMIGKADIFVQNLKPGATTRAGFGSAQLRGKHPRLITCDISGYGEEGPLKDRKAYDLLIQCETGLASITGTADAPGRVGVSVADIACGMYAHAAVLEALLVRARTTIGSGIAVSLFDAIADWMSVPLLHTAYGGQPPRRVGLAHPSIVPYGAFETADGRSIVLAVQNEREWRDLCRIVLSAPSLAQDSRFAGNSSRVANRQSCDALIAARLARCTYAEAVELLNEAHLAFGDVNSVSDLLRHPHLRQTEVTTPSGMVQLAETPIRWDESGRTHRFGGSVPALGEHSAALRQEFAGISAPPACG